MTQRDKPKFQKMKITAEEKHQPTITQSSALGYKNIKTDAPKTKPIYFQTQCLLNNQNGKSEQAKTKLKNKTIVEETKFEEPATIKPKLDTKNISLALRDKLNNTIHTVKTEEQSRLLVRTNIKCYVCFEWMSEGQLIIIEKCKHGLHKSCLLPSLEYQLSQGKTELTCPFEGCHTNHLSEKFLRLVLSPTDRKRFLRFQAIIFIQGKRRQDVWQPCPQPNCKELFRKRGALKGKEGDAWYICNTSKQKYCLKCNKKYHHQLVDCKEYQRSLDPNSDEYKLITFIQQAGFKQCPKCKKFVEKNEGCNHITCRCKYEFCYACEGPYPNCNCLTVVAHRNRMQGVGNR